MKKLLSVALATIMMVSTASVSFAKAGFPTEKADAKMWISYDRYDESYGGYIYNVEYDIGTTLTKITSIGFGANAKFTGKGINQVSFKINIDTDVCQFDYMGGQGVGSYEDFAVNPIVEQDSKTGEEVSRLSFNAYFTDDNATKFLSAEKGQVAWFLVVPVNNETFDPETYKFELADGMIQTKSYNGGKKDEYTEWTEFSNLTNADYPLLYTQGVEVLTDVKEDGKIIVAHTKNVEGVTNETVVTVSYPGEESRVYANFFDALNAQGGGALTGTVRFAVKAPASMDPNGFSFKIN